MSDPVVWAALTTAPSQAAAEALAEAAEDALAPEGVGTFEIEDGSGRWEVGLHFEDEAPDEIALALLAEAHGAAPFAVSAVPETDWVAHVKRELAPVHAGRFWVHGTHDAGSAPAGTEPLLIEAAMAFGTGHHGTTRGCLEALERMAETRPARVADVGCGTAVLAMAAARLWPEAEVVASDNDPVAVATARANCAVNSVPQIVLVEAEGMDHPALAGPFDVILANILMQPLIALAPAMAARLAPGGVAVLSGILTPQAAPVADAWAAEGVTDAVRHDLGEWSVLEVRRGA